MSRTITPPRANRSYQFTSATATTSFVGNPIGWLCMAAAGNITMKDEGGTAVAYTGVLAGQVIPGPFSEFTSTTSAKVWLGDGPAPPAAPASSSFSELYTNALTAQGPIYLPASSFYLLTGAPLAIFANGASAVPGSTIVNSRAFGVRWNNNATLDGIQTEFAIPPTMDITANATLYIHAGKTGATVGDAVTFGVGAFNQVVGALWDADSDFGGTTSAMTGDVTAKTVQAVTLTLALANLAAYPASVTLTIKPTDGTLGTDDLVFLGAYILYKQKLLTS